MKIVLGKLKDVSPYRHSQQYITFSSEKYSLETNLAWLEAILLMTHYPVVLVSSDISGMYAEEVKYLIEHDEVGRIETSNILIAQALSNFML